MFNKEMLIISVLVLSAFVSVSDTFPQAAVDDVIPPQQETTTDITTLEVSATETYSETLQGCQNKPNPADGGCSQCDCWGDEWFCIPFECMAPRCVDSIKPPGECCHICPNGENCYIDGHIVKFDDIYERENQDKCFCVMESMWDSVEMECISPPLLTDPTIKYDEPIEQETTTDITTLEVSATETYSETLQGCQNKPNPADGGCSQCNCWGDEWYCLPYECMTPRCVDPIRPPGECCPTCPNGENCYIDGHIVKFGDGYERENGEICHCYIGSGLGATLEIECDPLPSVIDPTRDYDEPTDQIL